MFRSVLFSAVLLLGLLIGSAPAEAQATVADYVQTITLHDRYQALAINVVREAHTAITSDTTISCGTAGH